MNDYYTYEHDAGPGRGIFYVGKGCKKRAYAKDRNKDWKKVVEEYPNYEIRIIKDNLSNKEALFLEAETIEKYNALGYILTNRDCGGKNGNSILIRKQISDKMKIIAKNRPPVSQETRAKMRASRKLSEEKRKASCIKKYGKPSGKGNTGHKHTEEWKANQSLRHTGFKHSEKTKIYIGDIQRGKKQNPINVKKRAIALSFVLQSRKLTGVGIKPNYRKGMTWFTSDTGKRIWVNPDTITKYKADTNY